MSAPTVRLRLLSLGAGVQSTTLALMAAAGEFGDMPDAAIFADTGWEPAATYQHLDQLEKMLPFPVIRVSKGNIREDLTENGRKRFATMPLFILRPDKGGPSMVMRQCTKEYKLEPIAKAVSRLCAERGIKKRPGAVEQWIGISLDEAQRMKPSRVKYIGHRWPLIEQRMTRHDCKNWLASKGFATPPKSACIGCPFHDDGYWLDMKLNRPEEFADAVAFDAEIRQLPRLTHPTYLHRQLVPLDQVEFKHEDQEDLFGNECEGMCGV